MKYWLLISVLISTGISWRNAEEIVLPEEEVTGLDRETSAPARLNFHHALQVYHSIGSSVVQATAKLISDRKNGRLGGFFSEEPFSFPSFNVSESCMDSLMMIYQIINDAKTADDFPEWLIRMGDAQAKIPSAIMEGNIAWLGGFHQCMNLTAHRNESNPTKENLLIEGQYCLVTVSAGSHVSTAGSSRKAAPLIQIPTALLAGVCVPNTCSEHDVRVLLEDGFELIMLFYPQLHPLAQANITISDVRCPAKTIPMDGPAIGVIILLVIFATAVLIGTIYDVLTNGFFSELDECRLTNERSTSHYTTLVHPDSLANDDDSLVVKEGRGWMGQICVSLSAVSNTRRIFRYGVMPGELPWIHGMRVLSMLWIILGQTYALGLPIYNNLAVLPDAMKNLFSQIIIQSPYAVDTFLFLSGFLVAYRFRGEIASGFDCFRLIRFYINRYLRLFPVYMVVLGVYAALTKFISSGPIWPQDEVMLGNCSHLAWTNAFYINNYVQPEQMCMPWTWYIAIDFQLFIVAPLIVLALSALWVAGVALCGAGILVAVIAAGVVTKVMELPPSMVGFGSTDDSAFDQTLTVKYYTNYLITTYCRAAPYFLGILTAHHLHDPTAVKKVSFFGISLGWALSLLSLSIVVFGLIPGFNGHPVSVDTAAAFNSLSHLLWAGPLAWVAYSCMTGSVMGVNRVLGWSVWRPLSCISYSVFLISPIVLSAYYLSREDPIRFSHWNALILYAGNLFFSLLIGFLVYLFVEAPVRSLLRLACRYCLPEAESRLPVVNGVYHS